MPSIASMLQSLTLSNASNLADKATSLITNISTTVTTRNAFVRTNRLVEHNGHQFEYTLLPEPTYCSHCNKFFWLPEGQRCRLCKLISHTKCVTMIDTRCRKQETTAKVVTNSSSLSKVHKFKSCWTPPPPSWCGHCGTLVFVWNTEKCSSCSRYFHTDCTKLAAIECRPRSQHALSSQYKHTSEITIDQFEMLGLLGTGSFSKVYLARLKADNNDGKFAIKVMKKTDVNHYPRMAFNEWQGLQVGRDYHFLTVGHCCFQSQSRLYFVMEYVEGRDLLYYLQKQNGPFPEDRVRFHSAEIVLALIFMHKHGIVYRDLKLNNVILDQSGHCKLIDFGFSKKLQQDEQNKMRTQTFCGTPFYISPEVIPENRSYDYSVDWWSLGIMMYEMLCDQVPFNGRSIEDFFTAIQTQPVTYPDDVDLSDKAKSILEGLLTKDPHKRIGCVLMEDCAAAIKKHPFFLHNNENNNQWWQDIEAMRLTPPYVPELSGSGETYDSNELRMTPTPEMSERQLGQLDEVSQSFFDTFSHYSESFKPNCSEYQHVN